jgi:glycosyltransferase involved in cell wall biosynthesis
LGLFVQKKLVSTHRTLCVAGSGVDLTAYPFTPLPATLSFLFIGRMIREKGVFEYIQAAAVLKKKYPEVVFKMLAPPSDNPSALSQEILQEFLDTHQILFLPPVADVRDYLSNTSVFVLTSYREGVSRAGIEALSVGRPVITSDAPGCREIVIEGKNGLLVPPRDVDALIRGMEQMIQDPHGLAEMGRASRKLAEEKFNVEEVNRAILDAVFAQNPNNALEDV